MSGPVKMCFNFELLLKFQDNRPNKSVIFQIVFIYHDLILKRIEGLMIQAWASPIIGGS